LLIVLFFIFSIYKKQSSIESLEKETYFLSSKEKKFKDFQKLVGVGEFNLYFPDKFISLDEYLSSVFQVKNNKKISFDEFIEIIDTNDISAFKDLLSQIENNQIKDFNLTLNI